MHKLSGIKCFLGKIFHNPLKHKLLIKYKIAFIQRYKNGSRASLNLLRNNYCLITADEIMYE